MVAGAPDRGRCGWRWTLGGQPGGPAPICQWAFGTLGRAVVSRVAARNGAPAVWDGYQVSACCTPAYLYLALASKRLFIFREARPSPLPCPLFLISCLVGSRLLFCDGRAKRGLCPRSRQKCPWFVANRPARATGHVVRAARDRIRDATPRRPACQAIGCFTRHGRGDTMRQGHRRSQPIQVIAWKSLPGRPRQASG
jgi:hypothetical protein